MKAGGFLRALLATHVIASLAPAAATAGDLPEFVLVIEQHQFQPSEVRVPVGQKLRLVVENRDPTPEEFESYDFNREKIVPGNGRVVLYVGPLRPGRYEFFGEFNPESARGALVAE